MNDNENKMNNVKQFINEHKTGLIIGACGIVTLAFGAYCYRSGYRSGRIDQYNTDAIGCAMQFNEALKALDDETKTTVINAFNAAASNTLSK
jgi:hypothetical protein